MWIAENNCWVNLVHNNSFFRRSLLFELIRRKIYFFPREILLGVLQVLRKYRKHGALDSWLLDFFQVSIRYQWLWLRPSYLVPTPAARRTSSYTSQASNHVSPSSENQCQKWYLLTGFVRTLNYSRSFYNVILL